MRDGLLVKVINFDENLKRFVSLRTTAKFFMILLIFVK